MPKVMAVEIILHMAREIAQLIVAVTWLALNVVWRVGNAVIGCSFPLTVNWSEQSCTGRPGSWAFGASIVF